jgi:hypothetical protein
MKTQRSGAAQRAPRPEKPREVKHDPKSGWDHVDEAGWESFPASDPPARWAGQDKGEPPPTLNGEEEPTANEREDGD